MKKRLWTTGVVHFGTIKIIARLVATVWLVLDGGVTGRVHVLKGKHSRSRTIPRYCLRLLELASSLRMVGSMSQDCLRYFVSKVDFAVTQWAEVQVLDD
jgi:hypothetical protein